MATDAHLVALDTPPPAAVAPRRDTAGARHPIAGSATDHLAVADLTKTYPHAAGTTPRSVLRGISFAVPAGDAVALIGANGAGKSTLLHCCTRLIEPSSGSVEVLGQAITTLPHRRLRAVRAQIGFVFQRHNLVGRLSVLTNVVHGAQGRLPVFRAVAAWFNALAPAQLRAEAMHCLDLVGLADFASHRADQLSGGQSQRVAIARALMQRPALLLADEPAASLDPGAGDEVMALFHDLTARRGITRVFTSHNLHHARAYADRIIALADGAIVIDRPAAQLAEADLRGLYA